MAEGELRSMKVKIDWEVDNKEIERTEKATEGVKKTVNQSIVIVNHYGTEADKATKKMDKGMTQSEKQIKKADKASMGLSGTLKKIASFAGFAALAAGAGKVVTEIAKIGSEFQDTTKKIAYGTGATGKELAALQESFKKVGGETDESLGDVATIITEVSRKTDATGKHLEDLTTQYANMADIIGGDFTGAIDVTSKMFEKWNIQGDQQNKALDKMFVVSQKTGIGINDLGSTMSTAGAQLQALGFDFDTSLASIGKWTKEGLNVSSITGGMRIAMMNFSKEGIKEPDKAMAVLMKKIKSVKSETEATNIATKYFGKSGLEMAKAIRSGAINAEGLKKSLAGSKDAINKTDDANETFADKLNKFKNRAAIAFEPLGNKLLDLAGKIFPKLEAALPIVSDLLESTFNMVVPIFEELGPPIMDIVKTALPPLISLFRTLVDSILPPLQAILKPVTETILPTLLGAFTTLATSLLPPLSNIFTVFVDTLLPPFSALFDTFVQTILPPLISAFNLLVSTILPPLTQWWGVLAESVLPPLMKILGEIISKALPPLMKLFTTIINTIMPPMIQIMTVLIDAVLTPLMPLITMICDLISPLIDLILPGVTQQFGLVAGAISWIVEGVAPLFTNVIETITGVLGGIIDFITNVFQGNWEGAWNAIVGIFTSIWDGIKGALSGVINFVIKGVNALITALNAVNFTVPDWVPAIGGKKIGFNIPLLAEVSFAKGTKNSPDTFIAGEEGPELVTNRKGSRVIPAPETSRILGRQGGGAPSVQVDVNITIEGNADTEEIKKLKKEIMNEVPAAVEAVFEKLIPAQ